MSRIGVVGIFGLGLVLSGCVVGDAGGDGAFYPAGFTDGCRTGEASEASFASELFRREDLFETEASYRAGWRAGYAQCTSTSDFDSRPGDLGEWETR